MLLLPQYVLLPTLICRTKQWCRFRSTIMTDRWGFPIRQSQHTNMHALQHHHSCECLRSIRQYPPEAFCERWKIDSFLMCFEILYVGTTKQIRYSPATPKFCTKTCTQFVKIASLTFFLKLPPVFSIPPNSPDDTSQKFVKVTPRHPSCSRHAGVYKGDF